MGISRVPQKCGALGPTLWRGVCLTPYKQAPPLLTRFTVPNFITVGQTVQEYVNIGYFVSRL